MKVIIVGGGIGGLTTALMLHARGIDCEIYEQSDAIRELGVGINTLPHAIKELAELGLLDRLDAVGIRTYELFYTNRFGQEIWRELRGTDAGYDVPQFSIHRGRLQAVIWQAVRARLGEVAHPYRTSARRVSPGRRRRDRVFLRSSRLAACGRARRRAGRRRWDSFAGARHALSERRGRAVERRHALARRGRMADVPHRSLDGHRRRHGREARGLSDRRSGAARTGA